MKKIFITALFIAVLGMYNTQAQTFTGTLKAGSAANSVKAVIKSSTTFTGQITNVQFTFQVPTTIVPKPTVSIKNNFLSTYIPAYLVQQTTEGGFYNYLFAATTAGSPLYSFTAGTEIDVLEVAFSGAFPQTSQVRFSQVANGGSTSQMNFYIEIGGADKTNAVAPFYGVGAVNGGVPYTSYSYSPIANIVLPIKLTSFTAIKKNKDAILTWMVENQDALSSHFEIERSFNATDFSMIGRVDVDLNRGTSATYNFTDADITSAKSSGMIYYRIKQVNKDGRFVYSEIKNIRLDDKAFGINLYPNPAKSYTTLTIDLAEASAITIHVTDAGGKEVKKIDVAGFKGANQNKINLSGFPSGSYLVKVYANNQSQTISLVKAD